MPSGLRLEEGATNTGNALHVYLARKNEREAYS